VVAGQELNVQSPDGAQSARVVVPQGLAAGDNFVVRLPPIGDVQQSNSFVQALDDFLSPIPDAVASSSPARFVSGEQLDATVEHAKHVEVERAASLELKRVASIEVERTASEENERKNYTMKRHKNQEREESREVQDDMDDRRSFVDASEGQRKKLPDRADIRFKGQKLLMVQVPAGVRPGSLIHVEIPGENRTVAAQVPPNTTFFHVAYTPHAPTSVPTDLPGEAESYPLPSPRPPPQASSKLVQERFTPAGQKLLLVRVPPGTPAGEMLHVSVPDEPGRILAAQVPAGNVREFHVSYESRGAKPETRSMLPPANPYAQGNAYPIHRQPSYPHAAHPIHRQPSYPHAAHPIRRQPSYPQAAHPIHRQHSSPQAAFYPYTHDNRYQRGHGGNYMMPTMGGVVMGSAAYGAYEQFGHNNYLDTNGGVDPSGADMGDMEGWGHDM
jgi:hypothetical protein